MSVDDPQSLAFLVEGHEPKSKETWKAEAFADLVSQRVLERLAGCPKGFIAGEAYLWVKWQDGPYGKAGRNGAQVEDVVTLAISRLTGLQTAAKGFPCEENRLALRLLTLARDALVARTKHRNQQGVEGEAKPHDTPADFQAVSTALMDVLLRTSLTGLALPKP